MQYFNQARKAGTVLLIPLPRHLRSTVPKITQVCLLGE
jgi:hypothetical protein